MPGSTPATSQLDWLSSTTAMIVLSWSKATRDLLKSFSGGIRGTPSVICQRRWCHLLRRLPHTISPVEGEGFEPSVPRSGEKTSGAKSDLQEDNRPRSYVRRNKAADRLVRRAPDQPSRNLPPPPFLFRHRRARRAAWHGADDLR